MCVYMYIYIHIYIWANDLDQEHLDEIARWIDQQANQVCPPIYVYIYITPYICIYI